jgi:hypothetical protein
MAESRNPVKPVYSGTDIVALGEYSPGDTMTMPGAIYSNSLQINDANAYPSNIKLAVSGDAYITNGGKLGLTEQSNNNTWNLYTGADNIFRLHFFTDGQPTITAESAANTTSIPRIGLQGDVYVGNDNLVNLRDFRTQSKNTNGYQRLPGGIILQWGSALSIPNNTGFAFPIAFPTARLSLVITSDFTSAVAVSTSGASNTGFTVMTEGGIVVAAIRWFALGY